VFFIKRILYVLHSGTTGGTFLTNKDLMKNVENYYDVFLLTAEKDKLCVFNYFKKNLKLVKEYPRKNSWSATNFHDSWLTYIYFDVLLNFKIDLIHIRHFINHSFDLPEVAKSLNIPVIVSIHDFYLICPYYVLLNENMEYCSGVCNHNEVNCYNSLSSLNDINSKELIPIWRQKVSELINYIDFFITTADFVKNLFLNIYPKINPNFFKVIEHGRDFPKINKKLYEIPSDKKPIKILCPANYLNIMKGANIIKQIKMEDKNNLLEFHFLGNCRDDIENWGINHGVFERDEFHMKVNEIKPSFIGIFSIWPETFCHTLTESWSCGIPVLGSNIGVINDRILENNGGWIIDINNPKAAYELILSIAKSPKIYTDKLLDIRKISLKTTREMANEYLIIYKSYL